MKYVGWFSYIVSAAIVIAIVWATDFPMVDNLDFPAEVVLDSILTAGIVAATIYGLRKLE